eukprot:1147362-Pelagomonas_calceolata.AAC.6
MQVWGHTADRRHRETEATRDTGDNRETEATRDTGCTGRQKQQETRDAQGDRSNRRHRRHMRQGKNRRHREKLVQRKQAGVLTDAGTGAGGEAACCFWAHPRRLGARPPLGKAGAAAGSRVDGAIADLRSAYRESAPISRRTCNVVCVCVCACVCNVCVRARLLTMTSN